MNALEAKATALERQKARWMKLPVSVKRDIEHATYCGELHCIATYNLVDLFFFGDVLSKVFGEILI